MSTELIRGLYNVAPRHRGCVVTIGNFDGVHLGHQALLSHVRAMGQALQLPTLVMVFEPQPFEFFAREKCAARLTRLREKFDALAQCGIDYVLVVRFTAALAALTAEQFAQQILHETLDAKSVILGDDFHFGRGREGDFNFLQTAGKRLGFDVSNMSTVLMRGERVSSTSVRQALKVGDHALAEQLLGRPYTMLGRVVYGDQLGTQLGFPTANIYLHRPVTPVHGIYIVRMQGICDRALPGVANIGTRPTVGGTRSLLEVHLLNFNQNIYGRQVRVEFCEKLRDEVRFPNLELLKNQIGRDAEMARHYFEVRGEL